jgi:hypothetical protein
MKNLKTHLTEAQESKTTVQQGKLIYPLEIEFIIENDPEEFFEEMSDPYEPERIMDDAEGVIYARIETNIDKSYNSKMEFNVINNYGDIIVELDSSNKKVFDKFIKLGISKKDLKDYISNEIEDFIQLYNLEHKYL